MDAQKRKEVVSQTTLLASVFSIVLILASLFWGLIKSEEATFTLKGVLWLFIHQPGYWFVTLFAVAFPLVLRRLTKRHTKQIMDLNQDMSQQRQRMREISKFVQQLGSDNLDAEFDREGDGDILGQSLIDLRDSLRNNRDNSLKLKAAENQRKWTVDGLARISEILRKNLHDPDQLSFQVIKELTRSTEAIQGGFYLLDDSDKFNRFFELKAFFAYDRRKFSEQKISWGDGLVGTCALEKKVVHLKDIPETYISITSGLGESNPGNLILVPMLFEDEVYGVIELASLQTFDGSHVDLLEKAAESVASTLSAVRTNITTARLLEESKAQTQVLTSHEEEMRQNMEELQATQEEASRQTQRFKELEDSIDRNFIRAEATGDGRIVSTNKQFINHFELSGELSPTGRLLEEFVSEGNRKHFREVWKSLIKKEESFSGYLKHTTRAGNELWTMSSLSKIYGGDDTEDRIVWLALDATPEVIRNQRSQVIRELVEKWDILFELDVNGNFQEYNIPFRKAMNFTEIDLKSMMIFDVISPIDLEGFNRKWESLLSGTPCNGHFRLKPWKEKEIWIAGSFGVLHNKSKEVTRIIFTGYNASHEKQLENENREQSENLKRQEKMLHDAEKELAHKLKEVKAEMTLHLKASERMKGIHEAINDDSPAGVVATGPDNRIIFFNHMAEKIWNRKREEVLDQDINILFPEKLIEENDIIESFTRPGDFKITGRIAKTAIPDGSGKATQVMLILTRNRIDNENTFAAHLLPLN